MTRFAMSKSEARQGAEKPFISKCKIMVIDVKEEKAKANLESYMMSVSAFLQKTELPSNLNDERITEKHHSFSHGLQGKDKVCLFYS